MPMSCMETERQMEEEAYYVEQRDEGVLISGNGAPYETSWGICQP